MSARGCTRAIYQRKEGAPAARALGEVAGKSLQNVHTLVRIAFDLKTAADALKEIAVQKTEQERIRHSAQVETERIHAVRDVLHQYLDRSFDERRASVDALLARLDAAIAQGDPDVVAMTLDAFVQIARSSPLKELMKGRRRGQGRGRGALRQRRADG